MNIAKLMIPKVCTVFLSESNTVRQGLEIMTHHGYTAVPVVDADAHYIGCVTEGDFLRFILKYQTIDRREMENHPISELVRRDFCPALTISAGEDAVLDAMRRQNFVPIVDDRSCLCGILTRSRVIGHFIEQQKSFTA
ncbi:MAG: CBS domain-containing protein [Ruminococcaceae bacterium]|nr:CBS domain-containing protein [Oscillospiraceae bacterium]